MDCVHPFQSVLWGVRCERNWLTSSLHGIITQFIQLSWVAREADGWAYGVLACRTRWVRTKFSTRLRLTCSCRDGSLSVPESGHLLHWVCSQACRWTARRSKRARETASGAGSGTPKMPTAASLVAETTAVAVRSTPR